MIPSEENKAAFAPTRLGKSLQPACALVVRMLSQPGKEAGPRWPHDALTRGLPLRLSQQTSTSEVAHDSSKLLIPSPPQHPRDPASLCAFVSPTREVLLETWPSGDVRFEYRLPPPMVIR